MKLSPVRQQYLEIKRQYPDAILFFRLGDFYETFDHDAEIAARELEIVLTSRNIAKGIRVPMAGIPFHAAEPYLARLIEKGYHVAICEQVGDGPVRGLFPREVVRVVTPGTVLEAGLLPGDANNYLAAVVGSSAGFGIAYADVTTGDFAATEVAGTEAMRQELDRLSPAELIHPDNLELDEQLPGHRAPRPAWQFEPGTAEEQLRAHFRVASLEGFGLGGKPLATMAAGGILAYLTQNQPTALASLTRLSTYSTADFMVLDAATRHDLELTETRRTGALKGSLLGVLDETVTPMGRRLLRQWLSQPGLDKVQIEARLDQVEALFKDGIRRAELRQRMDGLPDIERVTNRAAAGVATPRDLSALRSALRELPGILETVEGGSLGDLTARLDPCGEVLQELESALVPEPPLSLGQPGLICPGYSAELDELVNSSRQARDWISGLETAERQRTGIKTLKVGYNKVFGYFIEVTKANSAHVPEDYLRKQTLVNAERYFTPQMKEYESLVLTAEERIVELESELFRTLCRELGLNSARLLETARTLGKLDAVASLAEAAVRQGFVRPELVEGEVLEIWEGRHPVVEQFMPAGRRFVPNDAVLEPGERVRVITGPNMSGKSTYLRQVALIVLMAQMGSFVPARAARIGVVDRIFTRIGTQDEIHAGQSTFMVEMLETANLLHHAGPASLLVLDEIGRGTSTYDGLSIAWAVVEFIHSHPRLRSRAFVATHYHELTRLAENLPAVRNYNVAVSEEGGKVVFLHKIIPGGADKSYGIHVAELAGLPRAVIHRAQEILMNLQADAARGRPAAPSQLTLFPDQSPLLGELESLQLEALSPLEALNLLYEWQGRFSQR
jgi:DNA mismatch repair protein MutS